MRGARGEAHAKEWPGAMMPALPALASRPSPSFSSRIVTRDRLRQEVGGRHADHAAAEHEVFIGSRLEEEPGPQRVVGVEEELG